MLRRVATVLLALWFIAAPVLAHGGAGGPSQVSVDAGRADARPRSKGEAVIPFAKGERLRYRVHWLGIPVGWAELSVRYEKDKKGKPMLHFGSTARSSGFFSLIYNVDDQVDSYFELHNLRSRSYRIRQSEGHYKSNKRIDFYHSMGKAVYFKNQNRPVVYDLKPGAKDPLSSLYFVRMQELEVGKPVTVHAFVRRKNARIPVEVLRKEVLNTDFGEVETYLLTPPPEYEGIFKKSGRIYIWLSADERKVPVKMKSEIIVGAITAVLVEVDEQTAKVFPGQKNIGMRSEPVNKP